MTWEEQLLSLLGAPFTQENVDFLDGWAQAEGSNFDAANGWNPFNIRNQPTGGFYGWTSPDQGVSGTASFIENGYSSILGALRSGNPANYPGLGSDLAWWSGHSGNPSALSTSYQQLVSNGKLGGTSPSTTGFDWGSLNPFDPNHWTANPIPPGGGNPIAGAFTAVESNVLVAAAAIALLLIGGIWLALGNQDTREAIVTTAKTAAEAGG